MKIEVTLLELKIQKKKNFNGEFDYDVYVKDDKISETEFSDGIHVTDLIQNFDLRVFFPMTIAEFPDNFAFETYTSPVFREISWREMNKTGGKCNLYFRMYRENFENSEFHYKSFHETFFSVIKKIKIL